MLNTADTRHTVMPCKIPFSPELFHIGIVYLLLWQIPSPQRSLGHSLFKQKFSQKFLCFFCVVFVCYFIKISKFALPGVMLMYERTSIDRKKEKKDTSWLLFMMFNCVFDTFPCGILGQVWFLIVSIPDCCHLSYFNENSSFEIRTYIKSRYSENLRFTDI